MSLHQPSGGPLNYHLESPPMRRFARGSCVRVCVCEWRIWDGTGCVKYDFIRKGCFGSLVALRRSHRPALNPKSSLQADLWELLGI